MAAMLGVEKADGAVVWRAALRPQLWLAPALPPSSLEEYIAHKEKTLRQ